MNARESENYLVISRSSSASKSVEIFWAEIYRGTCLQCAEFIFVFQYVQPCLSKNPKYTFYTIKSSLTLAYKKIFIS